MRGVQIVRELIQTQSGNVLSSDIHKKVFNVIQTDPNFIYRVEMADSIGHILVYDENERKFALTKKEFQEHYYEYMMDLVNDSDQMVKI